MKITSFVVPPKDFCKQALGHEQEGNRYLEILKLKIEEEMHLDEKVSENKRSEEQKNIARPIYERIEA